jgi:chromosome segregation ATPase
LQYTDIILESLPELQQRAETIKTEFDSFRKINLQVMNRAKDLEHQIVQHTEELTRSRQEMEQQRRQAKDKREEVNAILNQASELLAELTGRKYYLTYDH